MSKHEWFDPEDDLRERERKGGGAAWLVLFALLTVCGSAGVLLALALR